MSNPNHTREFVPLGVSRKRNWESETGSKTGSNGFKKPPKLFRPVSSITTAARATKRLAELNPACDNRLLAGHLANEFVTKGTLLSQEYDPARAGAAPVSAKSRAAEAGKPVVKHPSYADVANMLKSDGTHIPGIVNPTQLARWLHM